MKPIGKYIVISQIKEEVKTESGLLLSAADALDIRYKKGKVIAPGTDVSVIDSEDVIFYDFTRAKIIVSKNCIER